MTERLSQQSSIYKYGSRKNLQFIFTKNNMFGLQVNSYDYDSVYLYINIDIIEEVMSSDTPLGKFISDGFVIRVPDDEGDEEADLDDPIMLQYETRPGTFEDIEGGFYKYSFHRKLMDYRYDENNKRLSELEDELNENDCLNFAECSTSKYMGLDDKGVKTFPYQYETSILQSKFNAKPFGLSDEENIDLLKDIPNTHKNDNAVPDAGESYAIVRKQLLDAVMYHIGFCIYSYEGVNITLEANADQGREFMPEFGFYDRQSDGLTFHKRWKNLYPNSETIVITKRDEDVILREINEEIGKLGNLDKEVVQISEEKEKEGEEDLDLDLEKLTLGESIRESKGGKRTKKRRIYKKKRLTKKRLHKWSSKYKKSINCKKPKGFSQKQYCKYGRNK